MILPKVRLTLRSTNRKTGPIPVSTTASDSCPPSCALRGGGCYAEGGRLAIIWRSVERDGMDWFTFVDKVRGLPLGQLWRHNQAGDLPGEGEGIDTAALFSLVSANHGKRGFTYTHRTTTSLARSAIKWANDNHFVVNMSANSLAHADELYDSHCGPVATLLPRDARQNTTTPLGRPVVICPAVTQEYVTCATCKLCAVASRKTIIGFPAHGARGRQVERIFNQQRKEQA